jgi:hypothetical protein
MAWTTTTKVILITSLISLVILIVMLSVSFVKNVQKDNSPENIQDGECKKKDYIITPLIASILVGICVISIIIMAVLGYLQSSSIKKSLKGGYNGPIETLNDVVAFKMGIYVSLIYFIGAGATALLMYFFTIAF